MFDLTGKVALVTGAGQGVGAGIGEVLARQGAAIAVNDLHGDRAAHTVEAIVRAGGRAVAAPFDVADRDAVNAGVAQVERALGPVDILVNNAGIPETMAAIKFLDLDPSAWDPYIDVNLYGVLNCSKAVVDGMCERGWGRVITISSGAGVVGLNIGVSLYAAGKGGAIAFMRHLALETARKGVTANSLALGLMHKERTDRTVTGAMERQIPVGRLGTGLDVGYLCAYVASDEASWLTGQTININGGSVTS
jgi:NAD(P)-dependent dehydrogenase (short-subunit alcohol dehydrogenase family)